MNILEKIKNSVKEAFVSGWSAKKLAKSFCIGVYIAFSPFPAMHTVIMFIATWMFKLNFPVLFIATSLNNPWTIIPFFAFDYAFGYWLLHDFIGWNPSFASFSLEKLYIVFSNLLNNFISWNPINSLQGVFGSGKICLISFFIGGNILGIVAGFVLYPIVLRIFQKFSDKFKISDNFSACLRDSSEELKIKKMPLFSNICTKNVKTNDSIIKS